MSTERSRSEIEQTLARYGADQFLYGWDGDVAVIGFRAHGRMIRLRLPLPNKNEHRFTHVKHARRYFESERTPEAARKVWEQECRQRWRALALVVKAKLESVETGITSFEEEFLAHIVLPNGQTFGSWASPQIAAAYSAGNMPALLPGGNA